MCGRKARLSLFVPTCFEAPGFLPVSPIPYQGRRHDSLTVLTAGSLLTDQKKGSAVVGIPMTRLRRLLVAYGLGGGDGARGLSRIQMADGKDFFSGRSAPALWLSPATGS